MMHDSEPTTLKDNSQTLIADVWLSGIKMSDLGVKVTVVGYDFKVRDWGARIKDWSPVYLGLYEVPFKIDAVERIEETFPT